MGAETLRFAQGDSVPFAVVRKDVLSEFGFPESMTGHKNRPIAILHRL